MITGTLDQLAFYKLLHRNLATAIDHILQLRLQDVIAGKYTIEGDDIFYMVNEYFTKAAADCEPERHQQFTDIQIMLDGSEKFGYTPYTGQQPTTPFLPDNDVAFYTIPDSAIDYLTMRPGKFIIFFPDDIHQPEVFTQEPSFVRKLVAKIKIN